MVEIGSNYGTLRIRTVEANVFKLKGIKNWYGLEKFQIIEFKIWIIVVKFTCKKQIQ